MTTMKKIKGERQEVLSFRVTRSVRRQVEKLAAVLSEKRDKRQTMTDAVEYAVKLACARFEIKP